MQRTRLWESLNSLSPLEKKHFGQWLQSPFFCRKPQLPALFGYIQDCWASGQAPEHQDAWNVVFGKKKPYQAQALRQAMSDLQAQLEHFLVYREQAADSGDYHVRLTAAYRKRGLEKHFRQSLRAARGAWVRQPFRHAEFFDAQASIEYELYHQLTAGRRTEALNLQELSDQTDTAFIARKLRQACFALSHQTVYKTEYRFGLLDAVLEHVEQTEHLKQIPAIGLYYFCYLFLTEPEGEAYFVQFKRQLLARAGQLPVEEQRNLHLLALNFCIRKINQLNQDYFREALDLYQSALKAGLLLENGQLSHFAFNNIVAIAIKTGDVEWAESFIREQAAFLEKKHRDATLHLNLARIAYSRRQLKPALLHLQQADYKDLINNLIAKTLQLKIYFESGEFDALDAHLQSMQTFIRRQEVIGYHKTNYKNIVRYARRLMQLNPNSRTARQALRRQIETESVLTEKEWLLEMVG
ncbi:MAG: hypothetical protein IPM36_10285 [Lewinellaceae bacterium]|nr:hypothetical protein [Lewinellaceae bacterium]